MNKTVSIGGSRFNQSSAITGDGEIVHDISMSAGSGGSLTTRTDDNIGVVTADSSVHAFVTEDRVDVYWYDADDVVSGCRRGMEVTGASGAEISIDGGSGDNLPTQGTTVRIIEPIALDVSVLGTNVNAIALYTVAYGQFVFIDDGALEALAKEVGSGRTWMWQNDSGEDNPITGDQIETVYISHSGSVATTMRVGIIYDN
jgi:hypothetical protein